MENKYKIGSALLFLGIATTTGYYINQHREEPTAQAAKNTQDRRGMKPAVSATSSVTDSRDLPMPVAVSTPHAARRMQQKRQSSTAILTPDNYGDSAVTPENDSVAAPLSEAAPVSVAAAYYAAPAAHDVPTTGAAADAAQPYMAYRTVTREYEKEKVKHYRGLSMPQNMGFEAGVNESTLAGAPVAVIPRGNFSAGLLYNIGLGNHFALQPGLKYVTKGVRMQDQEDGETKEKLSLHYVEMPLNIVAKVGKPGHTRFMIGGGPYIAYLAGASDKFAAPGYADGTDVLNPARPQYVTSTLNKVDWGMNGFVGIQGADGIFLKGGAAYGLKDIVKSGSANAAGANLNFMISAGFIMGRL